MGARIEENGKIEKYARTEQCHAMMRAALIGAVNNMQPFGHPEIEQLKGQKCHYGDNVVHRRNVD